MHEINEFLGESQKPEAQEHQKCFLKGVSSTQPRATETVTTSTKVDDSAAQLAQLGPGAALDAVWTRFNRKIIIIIGSASLHTDSLEMT